MQINYQALFTWAQQHSLALFPIRQGFKVPNGLPIKHTKDWSKDPNQWAQWLAHFPGCNFGVECGPSGLIVLDPDQPIAESWPEMTNWLQSKGANPEPEFVVRSPTGGYHCYYRVPEAVAAEVKGQPNISKRVNVRAGNGYVVAPWSHTVAGGGDTEVKATGFYEVIKGGNIPLATQGMIDHCKKTVGTGVERTTGADLGPDGYPRSANDRLRVQSAVNQQLTNIKLAGEGERNNTLNAAAFEVLKLSAAGLLDEAVAVDLLSNAAYEIGLDQEEVERTLGSAQHGASSAARSDMGALGIRPAGQIFGAPSGPPLVEKPDDGAFEFWQQGDPLPDPPEWLIKGVLPDRDVSMIVARQSGGKTSLAVQLALSIMTGAYFAGQRLIKSGGVLYFASEDYRGVNNRFNETIEHVYKPMLAGENPNNQSGGFQLFTGERPAHDRVPFLLTDTKHGTFMNDRALDEIFTKKIKNTIEAAQRIMREKYGNELKLIVFDTLAKVAGWRDELEIGPILRVMSVFQSIAESYGVGVLVIDHSGRTGSHARGSTVKEDSVNTVLRVTDDRDADDVIKMRRVHVGKSKADEMGNGIDFEITRKEIGVDSFGDKISTPIITWSGEWGLPKKQPKAKEVAAPSETKTVPVQAYMPPSVN